MIRRRAFALATCVLWLLGVELLPDLHLGSHRDDHTHGQAGEIIGHGHEHADAPRHDRSEQLAFDVAPRGHAADGFAHRTFAIHQPAPPLLAPVQTPRAIVDLIHAPIASARDAHVAAPSARGPPTC